MQYATFKNGDQMPLLGLGTWKSNDDKAYQAVREAIKIGYRHFDCAARYENEKEIGRAFADAIGDGEVTRKDLWITSKLWNNCHRQNDVLPAVKESLADLRLSYLDLYLIHWPVVLPSDIVFPTKGAEFLPLQEVPILETWQGMEEAVDQGLVRHIGVSNFSTAKLMALMNQCSIKPENNQVEGHPFLQQKELLTYCKENDIWITAYSPLGSQNRPDRLIKEVDPILLENKQINAIAADYGVTPAHILIGWAIQRGTIAIPKTSNPDRLRQNLRAASLSLSKETMDKLAAMDRHMRYEDGSIWTLEGSPYTLQNLWDET